MVDFDTHRESVSKGGGDDTVVADCLDDGLMLTVEGGKEAGVTVTSSVGPMRMRSERERLNTFLNWPEEWGEELARLGFCSTNDFQGTVRCVFCGREVSGFSSPREAHLQHWRLARHHCRYLRGEDVGNLPLHGHSRAPPNRHPGLGEKGPTSRRIGVERTHHLGASAKFPEEPRFHQRQGVSLKKPKPEAMPSESYTPARRPSPAKSPKLGEGLTAQQQPGKVSSTGQGGVHWTELVRTARYPPLAFYQERLKTFKRWPLLRPSPKELARAGFFQVPAGSGSSEPGEECGAGDSVKCFWCGERIHRWQRTDDALLEHARLSPGCLYVVQLLGQPLHDDVVSAVDVTTAAAGSQEDNVSLLFVQPESWRDDLASYNRQIDRSHTPAESPYSPEKTQLDDPTRHQHPSSRLTSLQLDDLMRSPPVQTVLQMGFPRQLIRELLSHNSQRLSADTLCHLALQTAGNTASRTPPPAAPQPCAPPPPEVLVPGEAGGALRFTMESEKVPELPQQHESHLNCGQRQGSQLKKVGSVDVGREKVVEHLQGGERRRRAMCKVCSEAEVRVMFLPCSHLVCCGQCKALFTTCPLCHQIIEDVLNVYLT